MTQWLNRCSHSWEPQHHTLDGLDIFDFYLLATVTLLNCWIAVFSSGFLDSCYPMVHWNLTVFWHILTCFDCCFLFFRVVSWGSSIGPWCPLFSTGGEAAVAIPLGPEPQNNSKGKQLKRQLSSEYFENMLNALHVLNIVLNISQCSSACFQLYMLFWGSNSPSTCGYCKRRISTFLCTGTQRCKRINFGFLIKLFDGQRGQLLWQAFVYLQRLLLECGTDLALPWAGSRRTLARDGRCCKGLPVQYQKDRCSLLFVLPSSPFYWMPETQIANAYQSSLHRT